MDIKPPLVTDWKIYECTKITIMGGDGQVWQDLAGDVSYIGRLLHQLQKPYSSH